MFSAKNNQYKRAELLLKDTDIHPFWEDNIVVPYNIEDLSICLRFIHAIYHHPSRFDEDAVLDIFQRIYGFVRCDKHFTDFIDMCKKNNREYIRSICAGFPPSNILDPSALPYDDGLLEARLDYAITILDKFRQSIKRIKNK